MKEELLAIWKFIKDNRREIIIFCLATLFLTLNKYHKLEPYWLSSLVYYALLPLFTIVIILRDNPVDYGFRLGNYKAGLLHVGVVCLIMIPALIISARNPAMQKYYGRSGFDLEYVLTKSLSLISWEFILRGFLLFGLAKKLKETSILVQMIPFVLLHFGKPEIETIGCILSGVYFGYINYRTRALWPSVLIHLIVNFANKFIVTL
ncbi:CPBP family intramembrane metalloprotease [bacterium]|nr:CPBP family intramembrane metalloprotease [bacterium]